MYKTERIYVKMSHETASFFVYLSVIKVKIIHAAGECKPFHRGRSG